MSPLSQVLFLLRRLAEGTCSLVLLLCWNAGSIIKQLKTWRLWDLSFTYLSDWGGFSAVQSPSSPELSPYHHVSNFLCFSKLSQLTQSHLLVCLRITSPREPRWRFTFTRQWQTLIPEPCDSRHALCVSPAQQLHFYLLQLSAVASFESLFTPTGASLSAQALSCLTMQKSLSRPRVTTCTSPDHTWPSSFLALQRLFLVPPSLTSSLLPQQKKCLLAPSCSCNPVCQLHVSLPRCPVCFQITKKFTQTHSSSFHSPNRTLTSCCHSPGLIC